MPINKYIYRGVVKAEAIQISPHEKKADIEAFVPRLKYTKFAGLNYYNDRDEPVARYPDSYFFSVNGYGGYLNDWVVNDGTGYRIISNKKFQEDFILIPGTERHAKHKGPVSPTGLLGGSMSDGIYPAMNLEDALGPEARNILQLWLNLEYLSGVNHFGGGTTTDWNNSDWPSPDKLIYQDAPEDAFRLRYVRFEDIVVKEIGEIDWQEEEVHDRVVDIAYERKYNVPAGSTQEVSYEFEFSEIRTREEATSVGLENELKLRLGGFNTPAGAENTAKVKLSVEEKYGKTHTFKQVFSDKTTITGPADFILRGERSRAQVTQVVKATPVFDYKIIIGQREGGPGKHYFREVTFNSKGEFQAFVQGLASNDVGVVYQYTALVTRDKLRTWEMAPIARQHRQPGAKVTNHHCPLVFNPPFDDQISQGVTFYDANTGERIDPFNYNPGGKANELE